jgi:hypothetical protein
MSGRVRTRRVRHRKRVQAEDYQQYIIRIRSWEHSYSFGTTRDMRFDSLPLYEYSTLQFSGEIIKPAAGKYTNGVLLLAGRHDSLGDAGEEPPSSVGYINALEESLHAYVSLPRNRIAELLILAQSNRLQAAILNGAPLKWRKAQIRSFSLETAFNEDDY